MSEPKRWLEENAPRDIELLVRAARAEEPSEASLRRSLSAVGVGLATLGVAASAGAAGTPASMAGAASSLSTVTAGLVVKWVALGATLGTLVVGTAAVAPRAWERVQNRAPAAKPLARPGVASTPATEPGLKAPVADPRSTPSAAVPSRLPHSVPGLQAAASAASISSNETLIEEVRSVDRARAALAAGRAGDALARLDEYDRDFAEQRFAPEALYLRLEALASLGRTELARKMAERLLARYPNSPQGERARALLSKNP